MSKSKVDVMVDFMVNVANDDSYGYSQYERWGQTKKYDCSSLTITATEKAGWPVKSKYGATYTGNMKQAYLKVGFTDVTKSVDLKTGRGLKRGDVVLNEIHHVEVYAGNGMLVGANSDENRGIAGYKAGDQTGREIWVKPYYVYRHGWDCVLRPPVEEGTTSNVKAKTKYKTWIKNENWYGITLAKCNVRSEPSTDAPIVAVYNKIGSRINYDSVYEGDGYRWLSYISNSGHRRYVAYRRVDGDTTPWIQIPQN